MIIVSNSNLIFNCYSLFIKIAFPLYYCLRQLLKINHACFLDYISWQCQFIKLLLSRVRFILTCQFSQFIILIIPVIKTHLNFHPVSYYTPDQLHYHPFITYYQITLRKRDYDQFISLILVITFVIFQIHSFTTYYVRSYYKYLHLSENLHFHHAP